MLTIKHSENAENTKEEKTHSGPTKSSSAYNSLHKIMSILLFSTVKYRYATFK